MITKTHTNLLERPDIYQFQPGIAERLTEEMDSLEDLAQALKVWDDANDTETICEIKFDQAPSAYLDFPDHGILVYPLSDGYLTCFEDSYGRIIKKIKINHSATIWALCQGIEQGNKIKVAA